MPLGATEGGSLYGGVEYFQWREYRDGNRLLQESGPRFEFGYQQQSLSPSTRAIIHQSSAQINIGQISYDGHSQSVDPVTGDVTLIPARTYTDYLGLNLTSMIGQRTDARFAGQVLDWVAGASVDLWQRTIHDTYDAAGNYAMGYSEIYHVFHARAGLGLNQIVARHPVRLTFGFKYPLYAKVWIPEVNNLRLELGRKTAWFMEMQVMNILLHDRKQQLYLGIDSLNFSRSPSQGGFYQPRSRARMLKLRLTF